MTTCSVCGSRTERGPEITLMADYGCFTWTSSDALLVYRSETDDNLDLVRLGAAPDLVDRLRAWHAEWEREAYGDDPLPADVADTWEERGWSLARELQEALPDVRIHVWDPVAHRAVPIPDPGTDSTYRLGFD